MDTITCTSFQDELWKIASGLHSHLRSVRRPLSVLRLLAKEHGKGLPSQVLAKLSEINLSGLPPQTILEGSRPPPPMDTPGSVKARSILELADTYRQKTAEGPPPEKGVDTLKDFAGHVTKGSGGAFLLHTLAGSPVLGSRTKDQSVLLASRLGAAAGALEFARKKARQKMWERREKQASLVSPALQKKWAGQVGSFKVNRAGIGAPPSPSHAAGFSKGLP